MKIIANDMITNSQFSDKYAAIDGVKESIRVLLQLKKDTLFNRLSSGKNVFRGMELAPDYYFEQLFSEDNDLISQKEKSALRSLLVNFNKIELPEEKFEFQSMESSQCAYAFLNHAFLFSIPVDEKWKTNVLIGVLKKKEKNENVEINNIAVLNQIEVHKKSLGIRKYEFNPKHKINIGWGTEMDLDDKEAQYLLMKAVPTDETCRHLVAKKNGKYYSFRCHYDNCYHGYWDDTMPEKYRNIVDKSFT